MHCVQENHNQKIITAECCCFVFCYFFVLFFITIVFGIYHSEEVYKYRTNEWIHEWNPSQEMYILYICSAVQSCYTVLEWVCGHTASHFFWGGGVGSGCCLLIVSNLAETVEAHLIMFTVRMFSPTLWYLKEKHCGHQALSRVCCSRVQYTTSLCRHVFFLSFFRFF